MDHSQATLIRKEDPTRGHTPIGGQAPEKLHRPVADRGSRGPAETPTHIPDQLSQPEGGLEEDNDGHAIS
jgi:hypothetical protein